MVHHNIIIFGESGSGKSSVVNLFVGEKVAEVATSPFGCTFESKSYEAHIGDATYHIYDTAGLNETEQGRVPHWQALSSLYTLIRKLDGVSLLIYCMRGRIKENARANWELFSYVICGNQVPAIVVVTGVENDANWDTPNKADEMKEALKTLDVNPKDVVFVVPIRGRRNEYEELYDRSQEKLRDLVCQARLPSPWQEEKDKWFAAIYREAFEKIFCLFPRAKVEFGGTLRATIDQFVKTNGMTEDEADMLRATLLGAEKRIMDGPTDKKGKRGYPVKRNIIIFGESGAGKSSVVNMLLGLNVAEVANSPFGCTFKSDSYEGIIDNTTYRIYDTAGLNETEQGRVPHWQAIANLYALIRELDGVSLLIYCMRGRIKENARANWDLFNNVICGGNVPILAVVTGVENDKDWNQPEKVDEMKKALKKLDMRPKDVVFVVPIRGRHNEYASLYDQSRDRLLRIISSHSKKPWSTEKDTWFASIYKKAYDTESCFSGQTKQQFAATMQTAVGEFTSQTGMTDEEASTLRATLLNAEKIFMKGRGKKKTR